MCACVCACVHVCVCVCVCVCVPACVHVCVWVCGWMDVCMCKNECVSVRHYGLCLMHARLCVHAYLFVFVHCVGDVGKICLLVCAYSLVWN